MPRGPSTFRQRDVMAAIKAATAAGLSVVQVEVDKAGRIVILTRQAEDEGRTRGNGGSEINEWDDAV